MGSTAHADHATITITRPPGSALAVLDQPQGHRHAVPDLRHDRGHRRRRAVGLIMRARARRAGHAVLRPDPHTYNVFVTGHGLIMIFFMVMPAMIGGFGNWFVPLHDRRAGHGVPAHEQHLVLAAAGRASCCSLSMFVEGAPGMNGFGGGWTLYPPLSTDGPPRPGDGSRDLLAARRGRLVDPRRDQLHHHHLQHARAGHDAAQDAAVRLVGAGHRLPAAAVAAGSRRRDHHAADRPQLRHDVLRSRPAAATRSCTSTCSGSSATPKSTS